MVFGDILHIVTCYTLACSTVEGKRVKQLCQPCVAIPDDHIEFDICTTGQSWGDSHSECREIAERRMRNDLSIAGFHANAVELSKYVSGCILC